MNNDKKRGSEGLHSRDGHYPESGRVAIDSLDVKDLRDLIDELHVHKIELEAARAKSENDRRLLLAVMEALPVGVAITDANGGSVLSNNAYEQIWA